MEKVFSRFYRETFARKMRGYFSEVEEAFEGLIEIDSQSEMLGQQLLMYLFSYIKNFERAYWSTTTMLKYLIRVVATREVLFLFRDNEYMNCNILKQYVQEKDPFNMVLLAGGTLYYYYNMYERPFHSDSYNQKTDKMWETLIGLPDQLKVINEFDSDTKFPVRIKKELDERIFGQEEAKKVLAMAVAAFVKKGIRTPVMLVGPTGCGKTHLLQSLSNVSELKDKVYIHFYNSTELTKTGFVGDNLKDVLSEFSVRLNGRRGIFVFDEIDKVLAYGSADCNGNDVNKSIIHDMLTAIGGNASDYSVDTNQVLFVFLGAFENLEDSRKKQMKTMGFMGNQHEQMKPYDIRTELIKMGCSRQFIGRVGRIVMMETLDKASIRKIFVDEKHGVLPQKQDEFSLWGLTLEWDDHYIEAAVNEVAASDQGARYITTIVENTIGTTDYDMLEKGSHRLMLNEDVLAGKKPIIN